MATFISHALCGVGLLITGVWWTVDIWVEFILSNKSHTEFKSDILRAHQICKGRYQLRPLALIVTLVVMVLISEEVVGVTVGGQSLQHITMLSAFCMFGLQGVFLQRLQWLPSKRELGYGFMLVAFVVEGILFTYHLHGRGELDMMYHGLLQYSVYACLLFTMLDLYYEDNVPMALARAGATVLQGTWFVQLAYDLFDPATNHMKEDLDADPGAMMTATVVFSCHIIVVFVLFIGIYVLLNGLWGNRDKLAAKCCVTSRVD